MIGGDTNFDDEVYRLCHHLDEIGKSWKCLTQLPWNVGSFNSVCRVAGGLLLTGAFQGGAKNNCGIFDLANKKWEEISALNSARLYHSCVVVGNTVYVLGGTGVDDKTLKSVECLAVKLRQWTPVTDLPQPVDFLMTTSCGHGVAEMRKATRCAARGCTTLCGMCGAPWRICQRSVTLAVSSR